MSAIYWLRDPLRGGCRYLAPYRQDFVQGFYPPSEFEDACQEWEASNLPGKVFLTADEAMDASDEAFYASGFVWEAEDEEAEEAEMVAEAVETGSEVWDPMQEAARVAGRVRYYYWA